MDKDSDLTGAWEYLDFDLEVREGGPREYPLLVRSPAGEAREEMHFPFDELDSSVTAVSSRLPKRAPSPFQTKRVTSAYCGLQVWPSCWTIITRCVWCS
jgi:hypothetical protein